MLYYIEPNFFCPVFIEFSINTIEETKLWKSILNCIMWLVLTHRNGHSVMLTLQQHYAQFGENGKSGLALYTINNIRIKLSLLGKD